MNELGDALGQGQIPITAFVGLVFLSVGILSSYLSLWCFRKEKDLEGLDSGFGVMGGVIGVIIYLLCTYWGWHMMTEGTM